MAKRNKNHADNISPDEIFLDSENIPAFDSYQLEGKLEKPISGKIFVALGFFFLAAILCLASRAGYLQVVRGEEFSLRAENNRLRLVFLPAERGSIYDRKGVLLAWNKPSFYLILGKEIFEGGTMDNQMNAFLDFFCEETGKIDCINFKGNMLQNGFKKKDDLIMGVFDDWGQINIFLSEYPSLPLRIQAVSSRVYSFMPGIYHLLGYIGYPSSDELEQSSFQIYENLIGKAGVERAYENKLRGELGVKVIEVDSTNEVQSENVQKQPISGKNVLLTIDSKLQGAFYDIIRGVCDDRGFTGGAGVLMDVKNGDVLSLVSFPEYDSNILSRGKPAETIESYRRNQNKPFLNRAVSGLYAPGSIIKPFIALAALDKKIIDPEKKIFSSGSISLPNPYTGRDSIFYDWKAHGWVDMKDALAVSSNVYFYTIGGGYGDVTGLGAKNILEYLKLFGLGSKTGLGLEPEQEGVLPDPQLSVSENSLERWRIGDTYNLSIGQGDLQVTPLQMASAAAVIANDGIKISPKIIFEEPIKFEQLSISQEYFKIVREGMREAALRGTAQALGGLPAETAAKTGTAELGSGKTVNSWLIAFWPYKEPRYALSVLFEKGSASNLIGAVFAARQLIEWMSVNTPEYIHN